MTINWSDIIGMRYGYVSSMRKYFSLSGRSRRREYWMFQLIVLIIALIAFGIDVLIGIILKMSFGFFYTAVQIIHVIPQIAASVRRMHDVGVSGWWYLAGVVGVLGITVMVFVVYIFGHELISQVLQVTLLGILGVFLYFMVRKSQPEDNKYGPRPDHLEG